MSEESKRCLYYSQDQSCQELATSTGLCKKHESEYQQYLAIENRRLRLAAEAFLSGKNNRRGGDAW
jgi:hypothetical protein